MNQINHHIKNKGFSLIEVMVAVLVMMIGVVGSFAILQKITVSTSISSSRLVAFYLAQEGIEIIRNIRDTNWIAGDNWDDGLAICGADCEADYKDQRGDLTAYGTGRYLRIEDNGFYNYDSGAGTRFKRKITIDDSVGDTLKVSVQVEWLERGEIYTVTAQENLYKWIE